VPRGSDPVLEQKLREKIQCEGSLTYEAFLDVILYDEERGYYREGKPLRKDYVTSPEVHPLFGTTIGKYIEKIQAACGRDRITIIELGGGSGLLGSQILSTRGQSDSLNYVIVEKGTKKETPGIRWISELDDLPPIEGFPVVIANEFFDALPFHRVTRTDDALEEIYIDFDDGFTERRGPLSPQAASFLGLYPLLLNVHQSSEVNTRTAEVAVQLSNALHEGVLLVFDYGYHSEDLALGRFFEGSVVGYKKFMMRTDVFRELGSADITHHVNFDHLGGVLGKCGWAKSGEMEQYRFLIGAGILEQMMMLPDSQRISAKALIDPEGLGSMISVLGFTKNVSCDLPVFDRKEFCYQGGKI